MSGTQNQTRHNCTRFLFNHFCQLQTDGTLHHAKDFVFSLHLSRPSPVAPSLGVPLGAWGLCPPHAALVLGPSCVWGRGRVTLQFAQLIGAAFCQQKQQARVLCGDPGTQRRGSLLLLDFIFFPLPSLLELRARCLGGSCGSRGRAALLARWLGRGPARVSGLQRCGGGTAAPGRHGGGEERERGQLLRGAAEERRRRGLRCGEATGLEPCCWPCPLCLR